MSNLLKRSRSNGITMIKRAVYIKLQLKILRIFQSWPFTDYTMSY